MILSMGNRSPARKPPGMGTKHRVFLVAGITNKTTGLFCQPQLVLLRFLNHQNIISFLNNFPFQGTNSLIFRRWCYEISPEVFTLNGPSETNVGVTQCLLDLANNFTCVFMSLFICWFIFSLIYIYTYLCIFLFLYSLMLLSIYLSIYLIYLSIYLFIHFRCFLLVDSCVFSSSIVISTSYHSKMVWRSDDFSGTTCFSWILGPQNLGLTCRFPSCALIDCQEFHATTRRPLTGAIHAFPSEMWGCVTLKLSGSFTPDLTFYKTHRLKLFFCKDFCVNLWFPIENGNFH